MVRWFIHRMLCLGTAFVPQLFRDVLDSDVPRISFWSIELIVWHAVNLSSIDL